MHIIVDADACPKAIKEFLYKATERRAVNLTMVANTYIRTEPLPHIKTVVVPEGADEADDRIVALVKEGDLVITADIPLAYRVVQKGAFAIDPRGHLYDENSVTARLAIRDLMDELRSNGMETGGPASFSPRDKQNFAREFESFMDRRR